MMGLAKMAPDGWRYYAEEVGLGREDYFAGHGEEPGCWLGRGAEALGLAGEVTPEQMSRLFGEGCHPVIGTALGRPFAGQSGAPSPSEKGKERQGGAGPVAGYALSFSPPKSVSLLWALAADAVSAEARAAHDAALDAALEFLQDHAAFTRRGHAGAVQADTDGYIAAAFTHRTSRARDPQLHTHVLVSAKVRASTDGAWLALDGRELFEVQKAAGLVYKAGLRAELSARLGVAWGAVDGNGGAEVVGVPAALVEHFSKRRAQVEARAAALITEKELALGRSLNATEQAAAYQLAAYQSRAAKAKGQETTGQLRARWRREAIESGHHPDKWVSAVLGEASAPARPAIGVPGAPRGSSEALTSTVISDIERGRSTWGRADVVEALAVRIAPGAAASAEAVRKLVERATDELLGHADVVPLGAGLHAPVSLPGALRRRDSYEPTTRHGAARYTTWRSWQAEQAVLEAVEKGRSAAVALAPEDAVEAAVKEADLGEDQADAVRRICQGGERVTVMVGPAGSGKSRSISAARVAWQAAGVRLRGVAPSAVAAGVLTEQAGIPSETLAKFLMDVRRGLVSLAPGEVVLCDEASMVATRDLAALAVLVSKADGKLVLIGDHLQLGAVEAGGLFRLLVADGKMAELTAIRRFRDSWEVDASRRLRDRDASVVSEYEAHGRVMAGTRAEALASAHQAWAAARAEGRSVVMMASNRGTVDELAMRARSARVGASEAEKDGVVIGNQVVGVGDEVVTTHNDRRLVTNTGAWVRNGDRWRVVARRSDGALLLGSLDGRGKVSVPDDYVRENVALAYAVTVHKSQGLTTDEAVLVVDETTSAEHLYVGLTRGRERNLACVVCEPVDDGHRHQPAPSAQDMFSAALGRSGGERSATEAFRAGLVQAADTSALRAVLAEALRRVDALAGPNCSQEIERLRQNLAGRAYGASEAERLRGLVVAQQSRSDWFKAHPEVATYLNDLAQRARGALQPGSFETVTQPFPGAIRSPASGPEL
jgi:conjugative relaxase-like TrwC/TraI family protein